VISKSSPATCRRKQINFGVKFQASRLTMLKTTGWVILSDIFLKAILA